jgi:putative cell wall-binding protein
VLASDANYPDALAGSPLAVAKHGPLLLTDPSALNPTVGTEIGRVLPKGGTVYLLGGDIALSPAIDAQVQGLGDVPQRIAGADRFATAVAIAEVLGDPKTVIEATGLTFADALSAGAAAAKVGGAVLLTNGNVEAAETAGYLHVHPGDVITAVGGPAVAADPNATSVVGSDRYDTAVRVAERFFVAPTALGFASGLAFPDALAGAANIGAAGDPLLVVPTCGPLPSTLPAYLSSLNASVRSGSLYGGVLAVGDDVLAELEQAA